MLRKNMILLGLSKAIVLLAFTTLRSQGLIIDHAAVQQFDKIPDEWLQAAKRLTVHYAHTSHGMQIISGLKYMKEEINGEKYNVSYITYYTEHPDPSRALPAEEIPSCLRIADTGRNPDGYWKSNAGKDETRSFAATGLYNFSMFGWCGELSSSIDLTNYIVEYLNTLDSYEKDFPNMRFIYMTGPTDGSPAYSKLKQHNDQIRQYCINNNKILYDFADIESWDPDGNYYPNNYACSWCADWCNSHPEECINLPQECNSGVPTCCPHTHGYNCYIKAKAFWYMMACLAGWDPQQAVPVELMRFEGFLHSDEVELHWTTASEHHNYGFEIQRSTDDGVNFKKIGFINGNNTSSVINHYRFIDKDVSKGDYYYRLRQIDMSGDVTILGTIRVSVRLPEEFRLVQNYPNPFNCATMISYTIPKNCQVSLTVYNIASKQVIRLVDEYQKSGYYTINWNSNVLPSGQYLCRLTAGGDNVTKKMLLLR